MRKKRAILFDDEPIVLDVMQLYLEDRGYEVLSFREPIICPVYGSGNGCNRLNPCADVMITDYRMPRMNGADLLRVQNMQGCRVSPRNKALMSGNMDPEQVVSIEEIGITFFQKPVDFKALGRWLDACEQRMDLTVELGIKRRESRHSCGFEVYYGLASDDMSRKAMAMNISTTGLCMRTDFPLVQQQRIAIATNAKQANQIASVQWVRQNGPGEYLVGLHFAA